MLVRNVQNRPKTSVKGLEMGPGYMKWTYDNIINCLESWGFNMFGFGTYIYTFIICLCVLGVIHCIIVGCLYNSWGLVSKLCACLKVGCLFKSWVLV